MNIIHGTSALQVNQETPALQIVEKPLVHAVTILPEPRNTFTTASGQVFDVLEYSKDFRLFQAIDSAVTYCMEVKPSTNEQGRLTLESFINGRLISRNVPKISAFHAARYSASGYVASYEQAVLCAYDYLQMLVMSGRA